MESSLLGGWPLLPVPLRCVALVTRGSRDTLLVKLKTLIAIALLLLVAWIVLRIALAITSGLLHLLWVVALIMLCIWAWGKLRAKL